MKLQLLLISFLCLLSKVYAQLCPTPCYCPWLPPRCPPGSPLVLDGCGCCNICARRLGEPCNFLHVCDQSQGLSCDYSTSSRGRGGTCNYEEEDGSCEVNGKLYRDGEVFQPNCKLQCRCSAGGFTCVPLCVEDVRLPTPDCPHPKRVEVPGKCCQEWICERQGRQMVQDTMAVQRLPAIASMAFPYQCEEWSTGWSACSTTCGLGIATRVSNQNQYCRLETQKRFCMHGPCQSLMGITSMEKSGNSAGTGCSSWCWTCCAKKAHQASQCAHCSPHREEEEVACKLAHSIQKSMYWPVPSSWTVTGPSSSCFGGDENVA